MDISNCRKELCSGKQTRGTYFPGDHSEEERLHDLAKTLTGGPTNDTATQRRKYQVRVCAPEKVPGEDNETTRKDHRLLLRLWTARKRLFPE